MLRNSSTRYGAVTKALHWTIAILIILMLMLGVYMTDVEDLSVKFTLYNRHKSLGVLILILALCRVGWHLYSKRPPLEPTLKAWEKVLAHIVHIALYVFMIGMPLSGWLMSSAAGRAVSFFGLFTLPDLIGRDEQAAGFFRALHGYAAYTLMGVIALHVAGALKHFVIDRDRTLQRMLPFVKAAVLCAVLLATPALAEAMRWSVLVKGSNMFFRQNGGEALPVTSYDPQVFFEPSAPETSHIVIRAELSLAFAPPKLYDMPHVREGLAAASNLGAVYDQSQGAAVFTSEKIARKGPRAFVMTGPLVINGRKRQIEVPFTFTPGRDVMSDMPQLNLAGSFSFLPNDFAGGKLVAPPGVTQVTVDFNYAAIPAAQ